MGQILAKFWGPQTEEALYVEYVSTRFSPTDGAFWGSFSRGKPYVIRRD